MKSIKKKEDLGENYKENIEDYTWQELFAVLNEEFSPK